MIESSSTELPRVSVVVLISGHGSNFCALADAAAKGTLPIEIRAVVSDRSTAAGLDRARERGIPCEALSLRDFPSRDAFDLALAEIVAKYHPDLVVLAGYMKILSGVFVRRFAGRLLNIHPSLLPKYPGLHTHRRTLDAGDTHHGASVHFVVEALDSGPVIVQGRVPVVVGDSESSLAARVHQAEHIIYPIVINWFARGQIALRNGVVWREGRELTSPVVIEIAQ